MNEALSGVEQEIRQRTEERVREQVEATIGEFRSHLWLLYNFDFTAPLAQPDGAPARTLGEVLQVVEARCVAQRLPIAIDADIKAFVAHVRATGVSHE